MNLFPIYKKEIQAYFSSPIAYIIITIFLTLSGFFFYTDVLSFNISNMGGVSLSEGVWPYFFNDVRYIFLLVIPLLTMRVFAEEAKLGTIELLFTYPITDVDILVGKFLAPFTLLVLVLVIALSYPIALAQVWKPIEPMPLLAGYLGLLLLGTSFIACGIFISSLTENQVIAAVVTLAILILFWFLTWNEAVADPTFMKVLLRLSLFDRAYHFFQGVIYTKDVVFFLLFSLFFLFLTLQSMESRKWRGLR